MIRILSVAFVLLLGGAASAAEDPLGPFLDEGQRDGLAQRRAALLEHVDATVARFGDAAFFPESGRL